MTHLQNVVGIQSVHNDKANDGAHAGYQFGASSMKLRFRIMQSSIIPFQ